MGRRKLEMKLIPEKRARMLSFKIRKEGLMKKIKELTTLCDVKACMIIYGPDDRQHAEVYPKDLSEIRGMIAYYNEKKRDPCKQKAYGLSCYFKEREKQVEKELVKLREKKMNVKYPTWNSDLESERDPLVLRRLADQLSVKSQIVKSRIDLLKNLKKQELEYQFPPFYDMAPSSTTNMLQQYPSFTPGTGYNESRGEIVKYEAQVASQEYMGLMNDGSEYYCPAPINVDDGGIDDLLPLPQSYVSFPTLNEGDDLQQLQTYMNMITDNEGRQYLLPFN